VKPHRVKLMKIKKIFASWKQICSALIQNSCHTLMHVTLTLSKIPISFPLYPKPQSLNGFPPPNNRPTQS